MLSKDDTNCPVIVITVVYKFHTLNVTTIIGQVSFGFKFCETLRYIKIQSLLMKKKFSKKAPSTKEKFWKLSYCEALDLKYTKIWH